MRQRRVLILITLSAFVVLACIAVVLVAGLLTARRTNAAQQPVGNKIVYGLTLMPSGFDPHINSSAELGIVFRSVYDTLVYRDPKSGDFVPGLAEKWSVSADGLTYTFNLKKGVKFHDGEPFDARAVAANLDRIADPATKSQKALGLLGPYNNYTVVDDYTIQINLKSPYAPLLDGLAQVYLGMASPKAFKAYDLDRYQFHQVGTGPYMMVDYVPGDHITIRRNPTYDWGPPFYKPRTPQSLDEIEFRFFTDAPTRAPALQSGAAQIMGELLPTDAALFAGNSQIHLYPESIPGMPVQFVFNTTRAPTDKLEVRRALLLATNRTSVVDAVFQQFSPAAYGPLSAVTPFYDARVKTLYNYDKAAALDLLGKLGYATSPDSKILTLNGEKLHVVMLVPPWGLLDQVGQKIQSQWLELGIELELKPVSGLTAMRDLVNKGEYNLVEFDTNGIDPSILNDFYRSGSANNWSKYANGDLDSWLTRATESSDPSIRQNMYTAIQSHIMDQALVLPIRDYVNLNGASADIETLQYDPYGWFPLLANVTLKAPASASSASTQ